MKLRSTFLALFSLLLLGSTASAAPASTSTDPASADFAAIFSAPTAPVSPDCDSAKLPSFEPAPIDKASLCGPCSQSLCQGAQHGVICKYQLGKTYTCRHAYYSCSVSDCQCITGPTP